jgi:hypothetical protein
VVPRRSSLTTAAHHQLLRCWRPRRQPQPHRAHSATWGPLTAARGSGAAPGAQPHWGSPPSTTDGRPSAGGARRRTRGGGRRTAKGEERRAAEHTTNLLLTQNVHLAPNTQQAEQAGFTRAESHETCQSIFPEN